MSAPPMSRLLPHRLFPFCCLAVLGVSGCAGQAWRNDPTLAAPEPPPAWRAVAPWTDSSAPPAPWLDDYRNEALTSLVKEALEHNRDLRAAAARLAAANARAGIAAADRFPSLDTDLDLARSERLLGSRFDKVRANNFNWGLNFAWEADLWGRFAQAHKGARSERDAVAADFDAARLSLGATVAKTALTLLETRLEAGLIRENIASLEKTLAILDRKLEGGAADDRTALEISLSRSDVERARAGLVVLQRAEDASRRLIETLLGRYPEGTLEGLSELPTVRTGIPVGLPSDLLMRRPDLLAAERRIDARIHDTKSARRALLPSVRINAGGGYSTTAAFTHLVTPQNMIWNIGSNFAQQLFQGGRLLSDIRLTEADRDEAVAQYAETALTAFREVETALAAEAFYVKQLEALERATAEASRAERLSLSNYENGVVEVITVLESQRRNFDARTALLRAKAERLRNRVDLHLALGGGFKNPQKNDESQPPDPGLH